MLITDFEEIVEIKRKRKRITLNELADVIGKSVVYTRQVINGTQNGEAAKTYRQMIADYLDITIVEKEEG